jgi:hypothetical protein
LVAPDEIRKNCKSWSWLKSNLAIVEAVAILNSTEKWRKRYKFSNNHMHAMDP